MKVYYDKDADLEIIQSKKSCCYRVWKSRSCSRFKS